MKRILFSLVALGMTAAVYAQSDKKKTEKKEIIIEENVDGKHDKMVIIVDGEKVTINGKPADEYKGKKRIVIDDDISINGDVVRIPRNGSMRMKTINGSATTAFLGVETDKAEQGVKVTNVIDESAAAKAGLKEGDVITSINGKDIADQDDLVKTIRGYKPDETVDIAFLRDGKSKKVKATLGKNDQDFSASWNFDNNFNFDFDAPRAFAAPRGPRAPGAAAAPRAFSWNDNDMWVYKSDRPKFGMSIQDYEDGDGVKVNDVEAESNAAKAGLQKGDIITEVEGKSAKNTRELRELLAGVKDKSTIGMKVLRNGSAQNITVRVPKKIEKADL